jgi:hypothetical protein
VAGIYGRVLKDLGLLSKGDVIVKNPSDFIGSALGESEKKTAALLDEALGCVLVIDEAYGLHSAGSKDPYRVRDRGWERQRRCNWQSTLLRADARQAVHALAIRCTEHIPGRRRQ